MSAPGITYREDFRAWWPDYDIKPEACHARVRRCLTDMDVALPYAPGRRQCVQAGGHAGLWPQRLAGLFEQVHTFEPEPALYACLTRNVTAKNVTHYPVALGAAAGPVLLLPAPSAGSWRVDDAGTHPVDQVSIDSLQLEACDGIFLDVEGYEVCVLDGARDTIARCRPVVMVEHLPRSAAAIGLSLHHLGYVPRARVHSDVIYAPR